MSLLGAAAGSGLAAFGFATVTAAAVALRVASGAAPLRAAHALTVLLAALVLLAYTAPWAARLHEPSKGPALAGLLTGLGLLAAAAAAPPRPGTLARTIAVCGALAAAYALVAGDRIGHRLEAFAQNPNYLGALLAMPFVAAVGRPTSRRPLWLVPAAVCLVAMAETQSRATFIAAVAGTAVALLQGRSRRARAVAAVVVAAAVLVVPAALGAAEHVAAGDRTSAELHDDNVARGRVAEFAVRVAAEHPLRGIGFGLFPPYAAGDPRFGGYMVPHDDYLTLAAEDGLAALAVLLVLLWLGTRGRRTGDATVLRAVVTVYAVSILFATSSAT